MRNNVKNNDNNLLFHSLGSNVPKRKHSAIALGTTSTLNSKLSVATTNDSTLKNICNTISSLNKSIINDINICNNDHKKTHQILPIKTNILTANVNTKSNETVNSIIHSQFSNLQTKQTNFLGNNNNDNKKNSISNSENNNNKNNDKNKIDLIDHMQHTFAPNINISSKNNNNLQFINNTFIDQHNLLKNSMIYNIENENSKINKNNMDVSLLELKNKMLTYYNKNKLVENEKTKPKTFILK